jgi:hypothetical protein
MSSRVHHFNFKMDPRQIDRQTYPWNLGMRLTLPPDEVHRVLHSIFDNENKKKVCALPFVYVNHQPDEDCPNPHSHVHPLAYYTTEASAKAGKLALQKMMNRHGVKNITGCETLAISVYKTGFEGFIFYAKNSDDPLLNGTPEQTQMYNDSPKYVKPADFNKDCEEDKADNINAPIKPYRTLTPQNIVKVMRRFCRLNRIGVRNFKTVMIDLIKKSNWRPSLTFPRPIAREIIDEFEQGSQENAEAWESWFHFSQV